MVIRYRYTEWDGTQEIPPLNPDDILNALTDDLMNFGDLQHALRNLMQRAALLGGDVIQPADLGLAPPPADGELDRETIEAALARAGGVVSQAATELGLSRQALYRRMERLGIAR